MTLQVVRQNFLTILKIRLNQHYHIKVLSYYVVDQFMLVYCTCMCEDILYLSNIMNELVM